MDDARTRIERRLGDENVTLSALQLDQLTAYMDLLAHWNRRMNLTALDDLPAAVDRLIVEPVMAAGFIDPAARVLVDVGSGGGSPAVPLKVVRPDLALTMIEIKARKSVFLREVARHLGMTDVTVESARFEQVMGRLPAASVDVVSIRAVRAGLDELTVFAAALRPGGQQLWFLSDFQEASGMPAELELEHDVPLVRSRGSRLVVLRKRDDP